MAATDLSSALSSVLQVPGLQELLNNIITEQRQQAPLRAGVKNMAMAQMPSYAFGSGGRPDANAIPRANFTTPAPNTGDALSKILPYLLGGAGGAAALSKLLGGNGASSGGDLSPLVQAIKKLFGGGGGAFGTPAPAGHNPGDVGGNTPFEPNRPGEPPLPFDYYSSGPTDPSGGTGVGPGMQQYYGSGGGTTSGGVDDWGP